MLFNLEKKKPDIEYKPQNAHEWEIESDQIRVVDLIWNPGEDNFLALFKDSRLLLFG